MPLLGLSIPNWIVFSALVIPITWFILLGAGSGLSSKPTKETLIIRIGFLAIIALIPSVVANQLDIPYRISAFLGGTGLLIVVSVTMDTVAQIHSHLLAHQYEGLIKKSKLRGRRG